MEHSLLLAHESIALKQTLCLLKVFLLISGRYLLLLSHSETEFETVLITAV